MKKDKKIPIIDFNGKNYFAGRDPVGEEMASQKFVESEKLGKKLFELKQIFGPLVGEISTSLSWEELPNSTKNLWMNIAAQVIKEKDFLIPKDKVVEVSAQQFSGCHK